MDSKSSDTKPNKADVESRLHQTAEAMSERLASLQDEVSSTGASLQKWIVRNPLKSVGGMLAAGLAVGLLFGGSRRTRRRKEHAELIDTYLEALRDEVEEHVDEGREPGPALDKALRDRVPLVVYNRHNRNGTQGATSWGRHLLREGAGIIMSTGLSLLAREAIETLLASLDVEGIIEEQLLDDAEAGGSSGVAEGGESPFDMEA
jgi:ElaB/YqjD/DUF883 family membrane-anchored ribosome-binding protein